MEQRLRSLASDDVLSRYDSVKDVRLHSRYRNESYKHILVPVYSTSYYYEGKLYQVAINGQTGNIHGAYPKSPVKIAAIIIAILLYLLPYSLEAAVMTAAMDVLQNMNRLHRNSNLHIIYQKGMLIMGLFGNQFANVIEWTEYRDDVIFWKWANREIKKDSRLIVHQGQDAIFLYNGRLEGIFKDEGSYEIESQIIPFLSTLKGFKFGFNSGLRAEVLFVNTKIFNIKWGTKNAISLPARDFPVECQSGLLVPLM